MYIGAEAIRQPKVGVLYRRFVEQDLAVLEQLLRDVLASQRLSMWTSKTVAAAICTTIQGAYQLSAAAPEASAAGSATSSIRSMTAGLLQSRG